MSYPINYPTPQGANIQIFKEGGTTSDWVKPQGASFIWITLIGGGGAGAGLGGGDGVYGGGGGGGSGAVTNYMGPAFLIPDVLRVIVGKGGSYASELNVTDGQPSYLIYRLQTSYFLLTANGGYTSLPTGESVVGGGGGGGPADVSNYFSCMGFFQSTAGQNGTDGALVLGSAGVNQTASATTFLSGGAGGASAAAGTGGGVTANYGYSLPTTTAGGSVKGGNGFLYTQPIIVGTGGAGGSASGDGATFTVGGKGGIGCGGGGSGLGTTVGGSGGDGMVVIITW